MLLEDLLRSLIPPCLDRLMSQDDWAVAGDFWEEHGDDARAKLCRGALCVGGTESGNVVAARDRETADFPSGRYHALTFYVINPPDHFVIEGRFFVPIAESTLNINRVASELSSALRGD